MSTSPLQSGFLLARNSFDHQGQTQIEYWVSTESGPARLWVYGEQPVFFVETEQAEKADENQNKEPTKPLELLTFDNKEVSAVYSRTINAHFNAQDRWRNQSVEIFEGDIRLHDRYVIERFVCGGLAFSGEPTVREGYTEYHHCRVRAAEYTPRLTALSLDIECDMTGELFSVGLVCGESKEVLMIGPYESCDHTEILWFEDEPALIKGVVQRVTELDPDLIIGWNLINFDLKLLVERAAKYRIRFSIGRANGIATWRARRGDSQKGYAYIPGRQAIDGIDALRSATWSFPSFSLENVSQTLLGRGKKVEDDVDDRMAEIRHNFQHNKTQLAAYNLEDCQLVVDVFTHTKIIEYLVLRSQMTGLELDRGAGSVAAFTNLYLPRLHRGGYVAPNLPEEGGLASPGGYVMDSTPGLYRNVLVLDFKSLYPSIIRTFKIDPMGLMEGLKTDNAIEGFRGAKFHRSNHFLPGIIERLWQQRDQAKKENDAVQSQAIKIIMNSFYGVLGSGGCRFYDPRLASSITMRGHEIMQTTRKLIEGKGYTVIYGDTDSTFVSLDDSWSAERCREVGNDLARYINAQWMEQLREVHNIDCFLEIEFETHFHRFLMPTIRGSEAGSKKRYAGMICTQNEETGLLDEKILFKGLENVRTDWTTLAKDFQAELFDKVFHDQSPIELVKLVYKKTLAGEVDDKLVYRKQLRRKLNAYVKNVPPHVRAARLADEKNKALGKSIKYQNKGWISYVMTLNGPEPLEYLSSAIDYDYYIDRQLKPVADGILPFVGLDFDSLVSTQTSLF
ncbi:MAG: DNA polymerase-2 [Gammaproteobacteria bacterium]|jgi:DNA polymerase-2